MKTVRTKYLGKCLSDKMTWFHPHHPSLAPVMSTHRKEREVCARLSYLLGGGGGGGDIQTIVGEINVIMALTLTAGSKLCLIREW